MRRREDPVNGNAEVEFPRAERAEVAHLDGRAVRAGDRGDVIARIVRRRQGIGLGLIDKEIPVE